MQEWRQQFQKLESVNLRYDNQVIVNPDMEGQAEAGCAFRGGGKAAVAAGVKQAALITHIAARSAAPEAGVRVVPKKAWIRNPAARKSR